MQTHIYMVHIASKKMVINKQTSQRQFGSTVFRKSIADLIGILKDAEMSLGISGFQFRGVNPVYLNQTAYIVLSGYLSKMLS